MRRQFFLALTSLFHSFFESIFLWLDIRLHQSATFFYFFIGTLYHASDNYFWLRVKFIKLHSKLTRVVSRIDLWSFGRSRFLLDEFERVGMGQKWCEFFLEMVGFSWVFVDVVLDSDLN